MRSVLPGTTRGGPESEDHTGKTNALPCRILVEMKGLEWFIYNRAPQYDWVVDEMEAAASEDRVRQHTPPDTPLQSRGDESVDKGPADDSATIVQALSHATTTMSSAPKDSFESVVSKSPFLQMFPIKVECSRGAIIMGNNNTPSILVAHFERALGTVDARKVDSSRNSKQIYQISKPHWSSFVLVLMVPFASLVLSISTSRSLT